MLARYAIRSEREKREEAETRADKEAKAREKAEARAKEAEAHVEDLLALLEKHNIEVPPSNGSS